MASSSLSMLKPWLLIAAISAQNASGVVMECSVIAGSPVSATYAARIRIEPDVAGKKIKFTQNAVARAFITAPNAQIRLGRGATFEGGFCVKNAQTDKRTTLQCP